MESVRAQETSTTKTISTSNSEESNDFHEENNAPSEIVLLSDEPSTPDSGSIAENGIQERAVPYDYLLLDLRVEDLGPIRHTVEILELTQEWSDLGPNQTYVELQMPANMAKTLADIFSEYSQDGKFSGQPEMNYLIEYFSDNSDIVLLKVYITKILIEANLAF